MQKKQTKKNGVSAGKMVAIGAGLAAAGAGAYYMLGPNGKKHQKDAKKLINKVEKEIKTKAQPAIKKAEKEMMKQAKPYMQKAKKEMEKTIKTVKKMTGTK